MKPTKLSDGAKRARAAKLRNRPIQESRVKRAPQGWAHSGSDDAGVLVDDLDALTPESMDKLRRIARDELLFRIRGGREDVKLSFTFGEAASDLGFEDRQDQNVLLQIVLGYAMAHYQTPKTGKPLSSLKHSVLKTLIVEDHTSPFEIAVHDPEHWGRRNSGSLTSRVSEWGNPDKVSDPVFITSHQEYDGEHANGVPFTYYYLAADAKKQIIQDALQWHEDYGRKYTGPGLSTAMVMRALDRSSLERG